MTVLSSLIPVESLIQLYGYEPPQEPLIVWHSHEAATRKRGVPSFVAHLELPDLAASHVTENSPHSLPAYSIN